VVDWALILHDNINLPISNNYLVYAKSVHCDLIVEYL